MTKTDEKQKMLARSDSTYAKIGAMQRKLAWPMHKNDMRICEVVHVLKNKNKNNKQKM